MTGARPSCVILGGPNGAGKSTIYKTLALPGAFVNADNVARELDPVQPEAASLRAGRMVVEKLAALIAAQESFVYETTLSSRQSVTLLRSTRDAGYQTVLIFVALSTPDLHVLRVRQRVALGGHHIPEDVVRRRYLVTFANLAECLQLSETILIFDNSADGVRLVMEIEGQRIVRNHAHASNAFDRRIAESIAAGLSLPLDHILPCAR